MTLAACMAAVFALTVGMVVGVRALAESDVLGWESDVLAWVARDLPVSFSLGMGLEAPGNGLVLWGIVLFAAGVAAWKRQPLPSIAIVLGHTLAYLPVGLGWWLWDRSRPDMVMQGVASPDGLLPSFPSGHMVQTSFAYGVLMWLWWRSSPSRGERTAAIGAYVLLVGVVALGRLRVGAHWPSDVAAGIVIGVACTAAVALALSRAEAAVGPAGERSRVD